MSELPLRKSTAFWGAKSSPTEGGGNLHPTINLEHLGLNGFDVMVDNIANNTPFQRPSFIPIITRMPGIFAHHNDGKQLAQALINLITMWPREWSGISFKLNIEGADTVVGSDGQSISSTTRVTRESVTATLTGNDVAGEGVRKFLEYYVQNFIKHPRTQAPVLEGVNQSELDGMLIDDTTFDVILIEPDHALRGNVVNALWLTCCNITEIPGFEMFKSKEAGDKVDPVSFGFKAYVEDGLHTNQTAQTILTGLKLGNINMFKRDAVYKGIDASAKKGGDQSLIKQAKKMRSTYT